MNINFFYIYISYKSIKVEEISHDMPRHVLFLTKSVLTSEEKL